MMLADAITALADAIATAEGFYVTGSRAQRNHNPGNLTIDLTGNGIGKDGMFIVYASDFDGWEALEKQTESILTDTSHIYNSVMTIWEIAQRYTATDQAAWASIVATKLGVSIHTPISQLLGLTPAATVGIGLGVGAFLLLALWYFTKH